mgnify:CR=1 FL=1
MTCRDFLGTEELLRAWDHFDKLLMHRTQFCMFAYTGMQIVYVAYYRRDLSVDDIDKYEVFNKENAKLVYPYAKTAHYLWVALSLGMLLLSFKWQQISKAYIYWMIIANLIQFYLPVPESFNSQVARIASNISIEFILCYFNFTSSLILALLTIVNSQIAR